MTPEAAAITQAIAAVFSVTVAIISLIKAARVEKRAQEIAEHQLQLSEHQLDVSKRLIRPIVGVYTDSFTSFVAIELRNKGAGSAIVTSLTFSRNGKPENSIPKLVRPQLDAWDHYWITQSGNLYIGPHETICLAKLSNAVLKKQGVADSDQDATLDEIKASLGGIVIECEYTDILDQLQEKVIVELRL